VTQANQAALTTLALPPDEVRGVAIASLVKGFSFGRWLESGRSSPRPASSASVAKSTWAI
jgi:transcriptional regulator of aroF, aroG, tyrA and aromatic amino acid transport